MLKKTFQELGLRAGLIQSLADSKILRPSPIQALSIQSILNASSLQKNFIIASQTGSGKTLAFLLPLLNQLKNEEDKLIAEKFHGDKPSYINYLAENEAKLVARPKMLILTPTRELAEQHLKTCKKLCHIDRFTSVSLIGGKADTTKPTSLKSKHSQISRTLNQVMDVAISTPTYVLSLWEKERLFLGNLKYIVFDEADSLLGDRNNSGFRQEIDEFLPVLLDRKGPKEEKPTLIFVGATVNQKFLEKGRDNTLSAFKAITSYAKLLQETPNVLALTHAQLSSFTAPDMNAMVKDNKKPSSEDETSLVPMIGSSTAAITDRVDISFVQCQKKDKKADLLFQVNRLISSKEKNAKGKKVLVFCNSVSSCSAVDYMLSSHFRLAEHDDKGSQTNAPEKDIWVGSFHSELTPKLRKTNWRTFCNSEPTTQHKFLVTSDITSRGMDFDGEIDTVIMFELPRSLADFVHRAGRTGRMKATLDAQEATEIKGNVLALVANGRYEKHLASVLKKHLKLSDTKTVEMPSKKFNPRFGPSWSSPRSAGRYVNSAVRNKSDSQNTDTDANEEEQVRRFRPPKSSKRFETSYSRVMSR